METAKRILTKEKLAKQLTGQSSSSPFLSIREGHSRGVSFDTRGQISLLTNEQNSPAESPRESPLNL